MNSTRRYRGYVGYGGRDWSGRVTIYPAYRENHLQPSPQTSTQLQGNHAPASPRPMGGHTGFMDHSSQGYESGGHASDHTHSGGGSGYSGAGGGGAYLSRSAFSPMVTKSGGMSGPLLASPSYPPPVSSAQANHMSAADKPTLKMSASYAGEGQWYNIPSVSTGNLSQGSDLSSSHSSGGSFKQGNSYNSRERQHFSDREDRPGSSQRGPPSPSMRRHQASGTSSQPMRRGFLDTSSHSSSSSSPKPHHRAASGGSDAGGSRGGGSSENLARLRPNLAAQVAALRGSVGTNNFQEELMRLIDPDISLQELENTFSKGTSGRSFVNRTPRLHRTLSDESMCSSHTMARNHRSYDAFGSDVIFTTAVPAHVVSSRENLSREQRLSPRATGDLSNALMRNNPPRVASSPMLPLPDATGALDWSNLVDTATKAFQSVELKSKSGSSGALGEVSALDHNLHLQMGMKGSKAESMSAHSQNGTEPGQPERPPLPHSMTQSHSSHSHSSWRSSSVREAREAAAAAAAAREVDRGGGSVAAGGGAETLQRVQDLEARLTIMQQQLEQEREERSGLEQEVAQLREDNVRLQEESQTAAAQLRKFTEWFFNTIDRQ